MGPQMPVPVSEEEMADETVVVVVLPARLMRVMLWLVQRGKGV